MLSERQRELCVRLTVAIAAMPDDDEDV